jgi:hypothetical protein
VLDNLLWRAGVLVADVSETGVAMPGGEPNRQTDEMSDEIDRTLIDWFLTLSPWDRLRANANWARFAALRRVETETD